MKKKVLIFDIFGDLAHFRKYYSTSSPVTFSIIPPVTVLGVLGAILGLSKEENKYIRELNEAGTQVAVQILRPVKKIRMGINLINTKGNIWVPKQRKEGARTQIRFEFLKDVAYRLYVTMGNEQLFKQLSEMVYEHKSYYTVSLGISELLADFRYVAEKEFIWCEGNQHFVNIVSAVPVEYLAADGISITPGKRYLKERVPLQMNDDREVLNYGDLLTETQGQELNVKLKGYWESPQERIVLI
ncbi:CRISPR-associated protein Cas5h [Desulforamulus putei DSM 12395]|uniref:CRISPR-associated protein Cas5h n=1 Tax=Desulforamulus putei DSM 12395 TaxID=1121429 RepID=A0A1M5AHB6_9FIRM|nr:type I-B CRISPR-associated protein Cas5b [Desulforamulus putei]SHF29613.1 CRISPR-associated protein Cas5h [Desulforamulus putei DSM 12395]